MPTVNTKYVINSFEEALNLIVKDTVKKLIDDEVELASKKIALLLHEKYDNAVKVITQKIEMEDAVQANMYVKLQIKEPSHD